jgi:hypothetical protein
MNLLVNLLPNLVRFFPPIGGEIEGALNCAIIVTQILNTLS